MIRTGLLVALVALCGCAAEDDGLTPEQATALVPEAAGVPKRVLTDIAEAGASFSPQTLETVPLSMMLTLVKFDDSPDLRRLSKGATTPSDLLEIWVEAAPGVVTTFPADSLSDVQVSTDGDRATGSFRFRREGLIEGKVEFVAERVEAAWRIVEFRLPATGDTTRLQPDGTWKAEEAGLRLPSVMILDQR